MDRDLTATKLSLGTLVKVLVLAVVLVLLDHGLAVDPASSIPLVG